MRACASISYRKCFTADRRQPLKTLFPFFLAAFVGLANARRRRRASTFADARPKLVLGLALLKDVGQLDVARTDVPEEDAKGVCVHAVVVAAREQLRSHVDGRAHDATRHHGLWLAEAQVCELGTVGPVQLHNRDRTEMWPPMQVNEERGHERRGCRSTERDSWRE